MGSYQQLEYSKHLEDDRRLQWLRGRMLLDMTLKDDSPAVPPRRDVISLLPPGARERAMEAVTQDPFEELEEVRDYKLGSAMAAHLTHLMACGPRTLRDKLRGVPVRIHSVRLQRHLVQHSLSTTRFQVKVWMVWKSNVAWRPQLQYSVQPWPERCSSSTFQPCSL